MAIDWPSIALGSGTGTTYTSPDKYTWTWNGNSWIGKFGNSLGGFPFPWVIFDSTGAPTCYKTLSSAMTAATSGQTIHLYSNGSQSELPGIVLKDRVDINLNGHTLNFSGDIVTNHAFNNNTGTVNVKMYNGEIVYTASNTVYQIVRNLVPESTFTFESINFRTPGTAGLFYGSVQGGNFYSVNGSAFAHFPQPSTADPSTPSYSIVQDVYGESVNGSGIDIQTSTSNITSTSYINVTGVSSDTNGWAFYVLSTLGYVYLYNCTAIADNSNSVGFHFNGSFTEGTFLGKKIKAEKCFGISKYLGGFSSSGSTLIDCVGEGGSYGFENRGLCDYFGCSDSMVIGYGNYGLTFNSLDYDSVIDNCTFSLPIVSSVITNSISTINIRNCTLSAVNGPIQFLGATPNVKFNIDNCVIGNVEISTNPITIGGATGSRISNCTVMSSNVANTAIVVPVGSIASAFYLTSNTMIGCGGTMHPQLIGGAITPSNKGNLFY